MADDDMSNERDYSPRDVVIRQALQYAAMVEEVTGCRPLIQLAVSPELFDAVTAQVGRAEPGEVAEVRIAGGIKIATFDAVALREGWSDMLNGTRTLANAQASREELRAALAEALGKWERHSFRSKMIGGPGDSVDRARIDELRAKFLGGTR